MVSNTTVRVTESKEVLVKWTGHGKVRVPVCLTVEANRSKCKPFIVFIEVKTEITFLHE